MTSRKDEVAPASQPPQDALDAAMAEAFGGAEPARERDTVLGRIGVTDSKVLLREPPSDGKTPSPLIKPVDEKRAGRYQVLGEIARGGVGVVLKGHDVDLGRDVAMKVVREEHADNVDVLRRFVEEAQIGGQLQHPGIVPVYELGLRADGKPFFAMKLIKGRTLSALLAERKDLAEDRRRFVRIFEQVCQTVAYAHSRGVIHRDLKPSNVMVGAFGEVQVVDWGLAKVMQHGGVADEKRAKEAPDISVIATVRSGSGGTESLVGSVLGTPAYMPPEQARGKVDVLDERGDVFSLGAVLCEILTGRPPYVVEGREILVHAAQAKLDDAFARLDACGADPELVDIAKRCLVAAREARPANAGVVAAEVAAYASSVEERMHRAEIAAVEAAAHAEAEREKLRQEQRARKTTMVLAAVVVVAVLGGGALWWNATSQRLEKERVQERAFAAALDEADVLHRRAKDATDFRSWDDAEAAAKRADAAVAAGGSDDATRRLAAFHGQFDADLARMREAQALQRRALELRRTRAFSDAVPLLRKAIDAAPRELSLRHDLRRTAMSMLDFRTAAEQARAMTQIAPADASAWSGLSVALLKNGDIQAGIESALECLRLQPDEESYFALGNAYSRAERWEDSITAYTKSLEYRPDWASPATSMHADETNRVNMNAINAALDGHGELPPPLTWDGAAISLGQYHGRFADSAAAYERWMTENPREAEMVETGDRYNAACSAARAAAGEGRVTKPLDDAGRATLRRKAVRWLAADVAQWKALFDAAGGIPPGRMVDTLSWAKEDRDLAAIRDEALVAKLPADEQESTRALWTDLDALLARAKAAAARRK
jgi:tetratricopeptide (TPR) repeat protein/tRNA A-37 threonylcarbamoyl transferase component Bud32